MKNVLVRLFVVLFVISSSGFASANLNVKGDVSSVETNRKSDLYCGLMLPPEGEQGTQGQEPEQGQDAPSPSPSPTPNPEFKSNSQSDEEPDQN